MVKVNKVTADIDELAKSKVSKYFKEKQLNLYIFFWLQREVLLVPDWNSQRHDKAEAACQALQEPG